MEQTPAAGHDITASVPVITHGPADFGRRAVPVAALAHAMAIRPPWLPIMVMIVIMPVRPPRHPERKAERRPAVMVRIAPAIVIMSPVTVTVPFVLILSVPPVFFVPLAVVPGMEIN